MTARRKPRLLVAAPTDEMTGYLRVSTREQALSGAGMGAQRAVISAYEAIKGWRITRWREDPGETGSTMNRPGLTAALEDVRTGATGGIVVAKLDRLNRSVLDFVTLMAEARTSGWNIVALDLGIDLKTSAGQMIANLMAVIAQWERDVISERTRDGLAAKRAAGVRLGRPRSVDDSTLELVIMLSWRLDGSYSETARKLNEAGAKTAQGGREWFPATVRSMLQSQDGVTMSRAMQDAGRRVMA